METERLDKLREKAKAFSNQVAVLKNAEELVDFFERTITRYEEQGNIIQLSASNVALFPHGDTNHQIRPHHQFDNELYLWQQFLHELCPRLCAEISQLLQKYSKLAVEHRDVTLCNICSEDLQPNPGGRELRGVHLREKQNGDPEVSE